MQSAAGLLTRTRTVIQAVKRLQRQRRLRLVPQTPAPVVITDAERAAKYGFASVDAWRAWVLEDKRAEMRDLMMDAAIDELLRNSQPRRGVYALGGHE